MKAKYEVKISGMCDHRGVFGTDCSRGGCASGPSLERVCTPVDDWFWSGVKFSSAEQLQPGCDEVQG